MFSVSFFFLGFFYFYVFLVFMCQDSSFYFHYNVLFHYVSTNDNKKQVYRKRLNEKKKSENWKKLGDFQIGIWAIRYEKKVQILI